ncbi:MAG: tetratricopeptide repeat protein [Candidatus Sericytochromatia bacterium]|nr:tetratricopeptide repeat protein [Candidatus Sericytochromatia bacterium]
MSLNVNTNTPFDNHYQKSGLQPAAPATPASATPASAPETAPETPAVQAPAAPEAPLADTTDVSDAGSRVYAFAEKDISFGSRLTETGKTKAAQGTQAAQAVALETDNPAHLGAAKMLSEEGQAAYQDGDYAAAALFYEAACDYDKKSPVLAYNLACAYQKMGDESSASEMFEVAKGLDPLNRDLSQRIEDRTAVA